MTKQYDLLFGIYRMVPKLQFPNDICILMLTEAHSYRKDERDGWRESAVGKALVLHVPTWDQ